MKLWSGRYVIGLCLVGDKFRRSYDFGRGCVTVVSEVAYETITSTELCGFVYSLHFRRATISLLRISSTDILSDYTKFLTS